MPVWSRGRPKKRSASEDPEPVDEVPMDAQSPGGADETGSAENPPKDPPKAEMLNPVQKLMMYSQSVDQHKKETDNALDMVKIVCRENEEKEEANIKLSTENAALRAELDVMRQESQSQAEKLQHLEREVYEMKIELKSARQKCFDLTEEKRVRDRLVAEQREDLLANQNYIEELNKRLKEADGESEKMSVVLSRKHSLELNLKVKDARLKEVLDQYELQLEISRTWTAKARKLEEENAQLRGNLEVLKEQLSAVFSEQESLEREANDQKTIGDGLQVLLRDRDKEISEWKHAWDALNQQLKLFAVLAKEPSSVSEEASCSESLPKVPEFQLPTNCPRPSTTMLSLYTGRIAPKWYEVAHALGVGTDADGLLQTEHSTERKCLLCLKAWTEGDPEVECSWVMLFRVLHHFQLHAIAKDIHDELQKATLNTLNHSI